MQSLLETAETLRHRLPIGDVAIRVNDEGERVVHIGESVGHLHQSTQADLVREVARRDDHQGKYDRQLSVSQRKPIKAPLALHDLPKVIHYLSKSLLKAP